MEKVDFLSCSRYDIAKTAGKHCILSKGKCCPYKIAAEQKARVTYDNILRLSDDPDVSDVIKFLRAREIVHFQRFGEALRIVQDKLDSKNFYAFNPEFDRCKS